MKRTEGYSNRFLYILFLLLGIGLGHSSSKKLLPIVEFIDNSNLNTQCIMTLKDEQATTHGNKACVFIDCTTDFNGVLRANGGSGLIVVDQDEIRRVK